ncbi:MAG: hypothetical protein ISS15_01715 [Alphaproteobacteria bacterium]|nr:hypothetical protein [Alphaproteobacteria bacterium]MBL7096349.1 hypothetical protein [Alphaproteobacteria bacterium]
MTYENETTDNPVSRVLPWVAIAAAAFLFLEVTSVSALQPAPKTATVETISVASAPTPAHS